MFIDQFVHCFIANKGNRSLGRLSCPKNVRKLTGFLSQALLLVLMCSPAFGLEPLGKQRILIDNYLETQVNWFQHTAEQNKHNDLRLKVASSSLFEGLAIWGADGDTLFPDRESATHINDHVVLSNLDRLVSLLASATPTAWERYDINADSLFYCRQDKISVCLLLNTHELIHALDITKEALFSALFPKSFLSSRKGAYGWSVFGVLVIIAVLIAWVRLSKRTAKTVVDATSETFRMGDMEIDPRRMLILRDSLRVNISARDLKLLTYLSEHPDEVLTKDKLYDAGWGRDFLPNSRALEQHIMVLRKKIDPDRKRVNLIETVHGQGYRYPAHPS